MLPVSTVPPSSYQEGFAVPLALDFPPLEDYLNAAVSTGSWQAADYQYYIAIFCVDLSNPNYDSRFMQVVGCNDYTLTATSIQFTDYTYYSVKTTGRTSNGWGWSIGYPSASAALFSSNAEGAVWVYLDATFYNPVNPELPQYYFFDWYSSNIPIPVNGWSAAYPDGTPTNATFNVNVNNNIHDIIDGAEPPTDPSSGGSGFELPSDWTASGGYPTEPPLPTDWIPGDADVDSALDGLPDTSDFTSSIAAVALKIFDIVDSLVKSHPKLYGLFIFGLVSSLIAYIIWDLGGG